MNRARGLTNPQNYWVAAAALAGALLLGGAHAAHAAALDAVLIRTEEAPDGWSLIAEERAGDVAPVPEVATAVQQQWSYHGEPFSIVYFLCRDLAQAAHLYERHAKTLGAQAVVLPLGPIVVELLDAPREVWAAAAARLGVDAAQRRKLVPLALPMGWEIRQEFLAADDTVARAGASLGAPIQSILVQVVRSPYGELRVNYMLCADRPSAARVYERSSPGARPDAFVTLDGPVVVEIIAQDPAALLPALEIVEVAPLMARDTGA